MLEVLVSIGFGFGIGYCYYHPEKVKQMLSNLIALIDKNTGT